MTNDWGLPFEFVKDVIKINGEAAKEGNKTPFPKVNKDAPVLLLYGTAGSGKTSLAVDIALGGEGWLFVSCVELLDRMVECKLGDDVKKLERRAKDASRLIIDEAGLEGNVRFTKFADFNSLDIIRKILMARLVANKRTIITTNMAPEAMFAKYDKINDASGRVYSRFTNHARMYFMEGDRRQKEKPNQIFRCREKQHLDELFMLDKKEGEEKAKSLIPLGDRVKVAITLFDETDKELYKQEDDPLTEKKIKESIKAVRGKGRLEDIFFEWLKKTEFKNMIPEAWHEQARARKKAEVSEKRAGQRKVKDGVAGPAGEAATGGDVRGGDVPDRIQRRPAGTAKASGDGNASGAAAVDPNAVPDWE